MKLSSEGLRELYQRETARSARRSGHDCLTDDMLTRAAAGELSQSEREHTADHLALCSDCAQEYRAINSMKAWAEKMSGEAVVQPIPFPVSENGQRGSSAVHVSSRPYSFYLPYAVAAAALVLSVALGALLISKSRQNEQLIAEVKSQQTTRSPEDNNTAGALAETRRQLEEAKRRAEAESAARRAAEEELAKRETIKPPTRAANQGDANVNVPIIDLSPRDAGRGTQAQDVKTIQLSPDTDLFTLVLNLAGEDSSQSYSLEIVDQNNTSVWGGRNLRKSPYNNFTVALRSRSFPANEYRIKLYGLKSGRKELIEEYSIRLVYR